MTITDIVTPAHAQSKADCEQAGQAAEQEFGLPSGLLLAIGRVESGRWDPRLGRVAPWPWSIDVSGQGRVFDSDSDALRETRLLQTTGQRNIDIGCFQISLLHHPNAFADLQQAFDPSANARYAARFLTSLRSRLGTWQDAIAAYHSADPQLGLPYRQQVLAAWSGSAPLFNSFVTRASTLPAIPVWVPSPVGTAPAIVHLHGTSLSATAHLPRIITPGG